MHSYVCMSKTDNAAMHFFVPCGFYWCYELKTKRRTALLETSAGQRAQLQFLSRIPSSLTS